MKLMVAVIALTLATPAHALERDKKLHAIVGGTIYAGARVAGATPNQSLGLCVAAGLAKEAYDATGRGTVEALDAVATAVPCIIAALAEKARKPRSAQHGRYVPPAIDRDVIHFDPRAARQ